VRNKENQTPQHLLLAMWSNKWPGGDIDTIRFFLERGADVDAVDNNHSALLHVAAFYKNAEVAQLLLEHGANINLRNGQRQTPLHRALVDVDKFWDNIVGFIQLLLEHGADVDTSDNDHSTPLHLALQNGSVRAARLLLEHGANVHLQNNDGQTPYQVASAKGHGEIACLLSEHSQGEQNI